MNSFVYDIPTKIYFGENQLGNLKKELQKLGKKVLITYGGGSIIRNGLLDKIKEALKDSDLELFEFSGIEPNPRIESVRDGANFCKDNNIDVLLAVGGGSTIDATKFIAAGALYDGDPWDFFPKNVKVEKALPIVTVLTLSATGSEMNNGGVISNLSTNQKMGRGSDVLIPKVSFLDPTNTYTVSKYQTACGSTDIMSHIMEVYFTNEKDLYMLDSFMEGLLKTVIKYAPIAMDNPTNYEARANLMWASTWAINGFIVGGKTQGWSCHTMEHQLSAFYDITHGLGLAILTPRWLKYCLDETTVDRIAQFGTNVFDIDKNQDKYDIANQAIEALSNFFFNTMNLDDTLTKLNIDTTNFKPMALQACKNDKIYGFKTLEPSDVEKIYEMCL